MNTNKAMLRVTGVCVAIGMWLSIADGTRGVVAKIKLTNIYVSLADNETKGNLTTIVETYTKRFHRFVYPVIWMIGIGCNSLCLIVWSQRIMQNSTACYFQAIAVTDMTILTLYLLHSLEYGYSLQTINYPGLCKVYNVLIVGGQYFSVQLVFAMMTDRFLLVWFPLRRFNNSVKRTRRIIALLSLGSIACATMEIFRWSYNPLDIHCAMEWQIHNGYLSNFAIANLCMLCLCSTLPIVAAVIINFMIVYKIRKTAKTRQEFTESRIESTPTLTLLGVSTYFIVSECFGLLSYVLPFAIPPDDDVSMEPRDRQYDGDWLIYQRFLIANLAIEIFWLTSYAINLYVFSMSGERFRNALKIWFARLVFQTDKTPGNHSPIELISSGTSH
ncbi:uncharacterized protein LOC141906202 [Tubulanus polymorphus]|uniref:uncharacterized protein LOC141906202 n=1 Tax=Tubulanus polymorphus TaxID=672921 RepID=UPI003DA60F57